METSKNKTKQSSENLTKNSGKKEKRPRLFGKLLRKLAGGEGVSRHEFFLRCVLLIMGILSLTVLAAGIAMAGMPDVGVLTTGLVITVGCFALALMRKIPPTLRAIGAFVASLGGLWVLSSFTGKDTMPQVYDFGLGDLPFLFVFLAGLGLVLAFMPAAFRAGLKHRRLYQVLTVVGCLGMSAYWLVPRGFYVNTLDCPQEVGTEIEDIHRYVIPAVVDGDVRSCDLQTRIVEGIPVFKLKEVIEDQHDHSAMYHGFGQADDNGKAFRGEISRTDYERNESVRRGLRSLEKSAVTASLVMRVALLPLFLLLIPAVFLKKPGRILRAVFSGGAIASAFPVPLANTGLVIAFLASGLPEVSEASWMGAMTVNLGIALFFALTIAAGRTLACSSTCFEKTTESEHNLTKAEVTATGNASAC